MKYAYFPGCSLHSTAREYDESTRLLAQTLGIELVDFNWNCCGASSAGHLDAHLSLALPARSLGLAEAMGLDILAPCAACYQHLSLASRRLKQDQEIRRELTQQLGLELPGEVGVTSLVSAFWRLGPGGYPVVRPLGIRAVVYYGCLLLRPHEIAIDDPDSPTILEEMMSWFGVESVEWPLKTECCGAAQSLARTQIVIDLVGELLDLAREAGAECIITACPLCHANLDMRQSDVEKARGERFNLPVYYFTELIGLALGHSVTQLGIQRHFVDGVGLLRSHGLVP